MATRELIFTGFDRSLSTPSIPIFRAGILKVRALRSTELASLRISLKMQIIQAYQSPSESETLVYGIEQSVL